MDQQELKKILELHRKWMRGEDGGIHANLQGAHLYQADLQGALLYQADLQGANLYQANLRGANLQGANLYQANLRGADLYGVNLRGANLQGANLYQANLRGADLYGVNLRGANLQGANLYQADLQGADLQEASLYQANLRGADLFGASLFGANLFGASLYRADLDPIKADYFAVLESAKDVVPGIYKALLDGKIGGRFYERDCAGLIGTIAELKGCHYRDIPGLRPTADRAAERWFAGIMAGDTPDSNPISKITRVWTEEFAAERGIKLPTRRIVWEAT